MPKISEIWADESIHCYWCDKHITDGDARGLQSLYLTYQLVDGKGRKLGDPHPYIQQAPFHESCQKPLENFLRNV